MLDYRLEQYFEGFGQNGTVIKGASGQRVVLADGRTLGWLEADRDDRALRWQKFGAMDPDLWRDLADASAEREVLVFFAVPAASNEELRAHLPEAAEKFRAALPSGVRVVESYSTISAMIVRGVPAALRELARLPSAMRIVGTSGGERTLHAAKNGVSQAQIDTSFNQGGAYGAGQRIGIIEDNGEALYDSHESFKFADPDPISGWSAWYRQKPHGCNVVADCPNPLFDECMPMTGHSGKTCVSPHASSVIQLGCCVMRNRPLAARVSRLGGNGLSSNRWVTSLSLGHETMASDPCSLARAARCLCR